MSSTPSPSTPLLSIQSRVASGLIHAEELEEAINRYNSRRKPPYRIDHTPDGDGWFLGTLRVVWYPPAHLGVILGEAVGQFVHALDNLMTALVRLNGSSARCYWPYAPNREKWDERRWQALLRAEHYQIVLREQPFNAEPTTALADWTLRDCVTPMMALANHDKHEAVHVGFVVPRRVALVSEPTVTGFEWLYELKAPLATGTRLYRVRYEDPRVHTVPMLIEPDVEFRAERTPWIGPGAIRRYGGCVLALVAEVERVTPEWDLRWR